MRPVSGFQIAPSDRKLVVKFHVNIITGSGAMTSSFYKELTRNTGMETPSSEYCSISGD